MHDKYVIDNNNVGLGVRPLPKKKWIVKIYLIKRVVSSLGMRRSRRLKRDIQVRVPDISE